MLLFGIWAPKRHRIGSFCLDWYWPIVLMYWRKPHMNPSLAPLFFSSTVHQRLRPCYLFICEYSACVICWIGTLHLCHRSADWTMRSLLCLKVQSCAFEYRWKRVNWANEFSICPKLHFAMFTAFAIESMRSQHLEIATGVALLPWKSKTTDTNNFLWGQVCEFLPHDRL